MKEMNHKSITEEDFLENYSIKDYERPSIATDMVIFTVCDSEEENYRKLPEKELRVLLIKRGKHPFRGDWALPGGFVKPTETTEETATRELYEEMGVKNVYLEQLYTFSDQGRDPRAWVMSCSYMALVDSSKLILKAGDDAEDAKWFKMSYKILSEEDDVHESQIIKKQCYRLALVSHEEHLEAQIEKRITMTVSGTQTEWRISENNGIAFDHAKILAYGLERLRGKIEYTDLALHLMPEYFSLTALQQVYEMIWDKPLLKAAFRRKIADRVIETEMYTENAGHRPSKLYKRNWRN